MKTTVVIASSDEEDAQLTVDQPVSLQALKDAVAHNKGFPPDTEFSLFRAGLPLEDDPELHDNDEILVVTKVPFANTDLRIFDTAGLVEGTTRADEPPLTLDEMRLVLERMSEAQRADVAILTEIGFDELVAFQAYCMNAGNNEMAVEALLGGGVRSDPRLMTVFICNRYPDVVQQVRPGLLVARNQDPRRLGRLFHGPPINIGGQALHPPQDDSFEQDGSQDTDES